MAINMYKTANRLDDMIRLVKRYHPDHVEQTHLHLAKELQLEEKFAKAEQQFLMGNAPIRAVQMYSQRSMWDDA